METAANGADLLLDSLAAYTDAAADVQLFRQKHAPVLKQLAALEAKLALCEADLKAIARQQGPCANANYTVTVQRKTRRWYDVTFLVERLPWLRTVPGVVVVNESLDKAKVEGLIKAGVVPGADAEAALREEPLTPSVTIRPTPAAVAIELSTSAQHDPAPDASLALGEHDLPF